jgi:hypothetical protein
VSDRQDAHPGFSSCVLGFDCGFAMIQRDEYVSQRGLSEPVFWLIHLYKLFVLGLVNASLETAS